MSDISVENDVRDIKDGRIKSIPMSLMVKRVQARVLHGDVCNDQKALVFEGEVGCGKTTILKQAFKDMGLDPICVTLGAQQMEDLLAAGVDVVHDKEGARIVQAVHESLVPTENHVKSGKYTFKVNGKEKTVIPWFFDEVFTGNVGQMNQLRAALTLRQVGSVIIPPQVAIFGTTNPESAEYLSRKSVDAAIMDRCEVIRVYLTFEEHQAYLAQLEAAGQYPEVCRTFLRMDETHELWSNASPRFWHQGFGGVWQELSMAEFLTEDERLELFTQALSGHWQEVAKRNKLRRSKEKLPMTPEALIARFKQFLAHGNDPRYYPISAVKIIEAAKDKKAAAEQVELLKYWKDNSNQSFPGLTMCDLVSVLPTFKGTMDTTTYKHIVELLTHASPAIGIEFIRRMYTQCVLTAPEVCKGVYAASKGTPVHEFVKTAMDNGSKLTEAAKAPKTAKGAKPIKSAFLN